MSRLVRGVGAVVCLVGAALMLLLAADARGWGKRLASDDLRFAASPVPADLWRPSELAPFGFARSVLGIDDDVRYRKAVQLFRLGRPLENLSTRSIEALRARAQIALANVSQTGNDRARQSQAENLLGVLNLSLAVRDSTLATTFLHNAIASFQDAIALDDSNADARFNLEYALYELKSGEDQLPKGTERPGQPGGRAALAEPGRGY